ncbi:MAG: hypothetical protein REI11_03620 [Patulibacter sp.]|nr:hypothetical protein [Patulibacter sp.]
MNRPASLASGLPSPARIGRVLRGLVPSRRGAGKGLLILTAVFVVIGIVLVYSPVAHPRNLEVNGIAGSDAAQIREAIETTAHGQSTFAVSEGDLMKSVADYPQVAAIEIHAHPPFRLDLDVVMRPPVARVEIGGRAFVLAADGTVLDHLGSADVPKIDTSIEGVEIRETKAVGATGVLRILGAAPEPLLSLARSIRTGQAGIEVVMSHGPRLIFGNSQYAADKWAAAAAVIADGPAARASYIDLRVPGRPAVGGLGGSRAAGYADAPPSLDTASAAAAASAATEQATPTGQVSTGTGTATQAPSAATGTGTATGTAATGTATTQTGAGTASTGTQAPSTDTQTETQPGTVGTAQTGTGQTASGAGSTTGGATLGGTATP